MAHHARRASGRLSSAAPTAFWASGRRSNSLAGITIGLSAGLGGGALAISTRAPTAGSRSGAAAAATAWINSIGLNEGSGGVPDAGADSRASASGAGVVSAGASAGSSSGPAIDPFASRAPKESTRALMPKWRPASPGRSA